jgi:hypothetical protein
MPERIPEYLKNILHDSYRNILDYPGSIAIKKFSHTSKIISGNTMHASRSLLQFMMDSPMSG